MDADGASLVIHANPDDYKTDPSGNSGEPDRLRGDQRCRSKRRLGALLAGRFELRDPARAHHRTASVIGGTT